MTFYLGLILLVSNISYHCPPFVIGAIAFILKPIFPLLRNCMFCIQHAVVYHSLGLSSTYQICVGSWKGEFSNFIS